MNDLVANPLTNLSPPRRSFYEKLFFTGVERMTRGSLHVKFPDGSEHTFGTPGTGVAADLQINDGDFFRRSVLYGDIGFAEAYMDGIWDTSSIERVISWAIYNVEDRPGEPPRRGKTIINVLHSLNRLYHMLRPNSVTMSRKNIAEHYDLGNKFYELWLDRTMTYSSALFAAEDQSLEVAQTEKYDRLCRQLRLTANDHILEIGCGWGGFSSHAAKKYGCRITAVTISEAQHRFATERMQREGLADRVTIQLEDYRNIRGKFDKIVSIEMMEALGDQYLKTFFAKIHEVLKPAGIVALQYITVPDCRHEKLRKGVDFIQKHIFPGSLLLSIGRVNDAVSSTGDLFLHDLKDMGSSYARTLNEWWKVFNARRDEVTAQGFDTRFVRKWNYYLQYCEAAFATRNISVVQAVYTRPNNHLL